MIQHSTSTFHKILISTGLHANGIQLPIHIPGDYTTKSPAELWDQVPEAGKWQIVLFVCFLEFFSESGAGGAHYTKGGKPGAFPSFNVRAPAPTSRGAVASTPRRVVAPTPRGDRVVAA